MPTGSGKSSIERSVLQSTKMEEVGDLKSIFTLDMEMQSLEFAQLVFGLALVQYFPNMMFWNDNVYPVLLKVYDLLFHFDFIGNYS